MQHFHAVARLLIHTHYDVPVCSTLSGSLMPSLATKQNNKKKTQQAKVQCDMHHPVKKLYMDICKTKQPARSTDHVSTHSLSVWYAAPCQGAPCWPWQQAGGPCRQGAPPDPHPYAHWQPCARESVHPAQHLTAECSCHVTEYT